jgi:hypothetical protein
MQAPCCPPYCVALSPAWMYCAACLPQAEELPHETQAKIRRFARTALQSSRTPLDLETDEGTAALARTFSEACETGLFG